MKKLGAVLLGIGFIVVLGCAGNFDLHVYEGSADATNPLVLLIGVIVFIVGGVMLKGAKK